MDNKAEMRLAALEAQISKLNAEIEDLEDRAARKLKRHEERIDALERYISKVSVIDSVMYFGLRSRF